MRAVIFLTDKFGYDYILKFIFVLTPFTGLNLKWFCEN